MVHSIARYGLYTVVGNNISSIAATHGHRLCSWQYWQLIHIFNAVHFSHELRPDIVSVYVLNFLTLLNCLSCGRLLWVSFEFGKTKIDLVEDLKLYYIPMLLCFFHNWEWLYTVFGSCCLVRTYFVSVRLVLWLFQVQTLIEQITIDWLIDWQIFSRTLWLGSLEATDSWQRSEFIAKKLLIFLRCICSVSIISAIGRSYLSIICPASNGEQAITRVMLSGSYRNGSYLLSCDHLHLRRSWI